MQDQESLPVEMYIESMEADAAGAKWAETPLGAEPPDMEPVPIEAYAT